MMQTGGWRFGYDGMVQREIEKKRKRERKANANDYLNTVSSCAIQNTIIFAGKTTNKTNNLTPTLHLREIDYTRNG